jgi:hypothetical protein
VVGPDLPFSPWLIAAVQLHHTGHSSIAQHFQVASDRNAGQSCHSTYVGFPSACS